MNTQYLFFTDIPFYLWSSSDIKKLFFQFVTEKNLYILSQKNRTQSSETFTYKE